MDNAIWADRYRTALGKLEQKVGVYRDKGQLPEEDKELTPGKTYRLSTWSEEEAHILAEDLKHIGLGHVEVASLILEAYEPLTDLIRAVKDNTRQPYKGRKAEGVELVCDIVKPTDIAWVTWLAVYVLGVQNVIANAGAPRAMGLNTAELLLGFTDNIELPKFNCIQITRDGNTVFAPENLEFDITDMRYNTWFAECKRRYAFPPNTTWFMQGRAFVAGDSRLRPILFQIQAANAAAL